MGGVDKIFQCTCDSCRVSNQAKIATCMYMHAEVHVVYSDIDETSIGTESSSMVRLQ